MSNRTYICIKCKTAKRAEAAYGLNTQFRCSKCKNEMYELPWEWRIPKKDDKNEWEKLRIFVEKLDFKNKERKNLILNEKLEKIDKLIMNVENQKVSERQISKIKKLKREREEILNLYK